MTNSSGEPTRVSGPSFLLRLRRRAFRTLPFVVWLGVLILVLAYTRHGQALAETRGIVECDRYRIIAPVAGTLGHLAIADDDPVTPGQLVGALDDDELRLRVSRTRFELEALRAELEREAKQVCHEWLTDAADRDADRAADLRRYHRDVERAVLERLATRAEIEEASVRQLGIAIELERVHELVEQSIAAEASETELATEHDALGVRIVELRGIAVDRDAALAAARDRLAAAQRRVVESVLDPDALLSPFRWRIRAQEVELETLALLREQITFRVPIGGQVEQVFFRVGEQVAAGDVLAVVVEEQPRTIVAFLPEANRNLLAGDVRPRIIDPREPGRLVPTSVESVGAAVAQTPRRLWRDPQVEEWSIPVRLTAIEGVSPGEALSIRWRR